MRAGDRAGALALRERTAALFHEPHLLADVAREYRELGMDDRALATFKRYLWLQFGPSALAGGDATAAREYAQFLRQAGRFEPAARTIERALAVARIRGLGEDETESLRFELAAGYQALGRLDELIRRQQARLAEAPGDVATMDFLATLHATRGDDDRAVEVRREIARRRPRDLNNLTQLALELRRGRRIDEAIEAWRRLLEVDPANASAALNSIAEMYYEKGDTTKAVEAAKMLLTDRYAGRATTSERLQSVAYLYGRMGLRDLEAETWRRAISETRGASMQAQAALVRTLVERGETEGACEAAATALDDAADDARRALIVEALFSGRSVERLLTAADRLRRVEAAGSDTELALRVETLLHDRLLDLGRSDLAADVLTRMWRMRLGGAPTAVRAARELSALARFAEAESVLRQSLADDPGDPDGSGRLQLARVWLAAGRTGEAERMVDEYLSRRPAAEDRLEAARALAEAGRWASALARLEGASGDAAGTLEFGELRADALARTGHFDRAAAAWEEMMSRFPSERAFLGAGRFFLDAGTLDRAETVLGGLLRLNPASLEGIRLLGTTLLRARKYDAATEVWRQAADAFDARWAEREFAVNVERLRRETGRTEGARVEAVRALDAADTEWTKRATELADALAAAGRPDEAAALYRKLASLARDATMRHRATERLRGMDAPGGR